MELIPIGDAARSLGINTSAVRYYEERGLVRPAAREAGRRMYGPPEMRRLALIVLMQRLGVRLDTAASLLDEPGERWRHAVSEQIGELDDLIERARGARTFLAHALDCPAEHPSQECPEFTGTLDRLWMGGTFEEFADEYRDAVDNEPPPPGKVSSDQAKKPAQEFGD